MFFFSSPCCIPAYEEKEEKDKSQKKGKKKKQPDPISSQKGGRLQSVTTMSLFSSLTPPDSINDQFTGLPYIQALRASTTPSLLQGPAAIIGIQKKKEQLQQQILRQQKELNSNSNNNNNAGNTSTTPVRPSSGSKESRSVRRQVSLVPAAATLTTAAASGSSDEDVARLKQQIETQTQAVQNAAAVAAAKHVRTSSQPMLMKTPSILSPTHANNANANSTTTSNVTAATAATGAFISPSHRSTFSVPSFQSMQNGNILGNNNNNTVVSLSSSAAPTPDHNSNMLTGNTPSPSLSQSMRAPRSHQHLSLTASGGDSLLNTSSSASVFANVSSSDDSARASPAVSGWGDNESNATNSALASLLSQRAAVPAAAVPLSSANKRVSSRQTPQSGILRASFAQQQQQMQSSAGSQTARGSSGGKSGGVDLFGGSQTARRSTTSSSDEKEISPSPASSSSSSSSSRQQVDRVSSFTPYTVGHNLPAPIVASTDAASTFSSMLVNKGGGQSMMNSPFASSSSTAAGSNHLLSFSSSSTIGIRTLEDELLELDKERRMKAREKTQRELGLSATTTVDGTNGSEEEKSDGLLPPVPGASSSSAEHESMLRSDLPPPPLIPFNPLASWSSSQVPIDLESHEEMYAQKLSEYTHRLTLSLQSNLDKIMHKIRVNESHKLHHTRNELRDLLRFYHTHEGAMYDSCHTIKEIEKNLNLCELENEELLKQQQLIHEDYTMQHSQLIQTLYALHANQGKQQQQPHEYLHAHSKHNDVLASKLSSRRPSAMLQSPPLAAPAATLTNTAAAAARAASDSSTTSTGAAGAHSTSASPQPSVSGAAGGGGDERAPSTTVTRSGSRADLPRQQTPGAAGDAAASSASAGNATPTLSTTNGAPVHDTPNPIGGGGHHSRSTSRDTTVSASRSRRSSFSTRATAAAGAAAPPTPPVQPASTASSSSPATSSLLDSLGITSAQLGAAVDASSTPQQIATKLSMLRTFWQNQFASVRTDRQELKHYKNLLLSLEKNIGTQLEMERMKVQGLNLQLQQMKKNHSVNLNKRIDELKSLQEEYKRLTKKYSELSAESEQMEKQSRELLNEDEKKWNEIHTGTGNKMEIQKANQNLMNELEKKFISSLVEKVNLVKNTQQILLEIQQKFQTLITCPSCGYALSSGDASSAALIWETGQTTCEKCAFQQLFPSNFQSVVKAIHNQFIGHKKGTASSSALGAPASAAAGANGAAVANDPPTHDDDSANNEFMATPKTEPATRSASRSASHTNLLQSSESSEKITQEQQQLSHSASRSSGTATSASTLPAPSTSTTSAAAAAAATLIGSFDQTALDELGKRLSQTDANGSTTHSHLYTSHIPFTLLWLKNRFIDNWLSHYHTYQQLAQFDNYVLNAQLLPVLLANFETKLMEIHQFRVNERKKREEEEAIARANGEAELAAAEQAASSKNSGLTISTSNRATPGSPPLSPRSPSLVPGSPRRITSISKRKTITNYNNNN